jgi:hypothetical protein
MNAQIFTKIDEWVDDMKEFTLEDAFIPLIKEFKGMQIID